MRIIFGRCIDVSSRVCVALYACSQILWRLGLVLSPPSPDARAPFSLGVRDRASLQVHARVNVRVLRPRILQSLGLTGLHARPLRMYW